MKVFAINGNARKYGNTAMYHASEDSPHFSLHCFKTHLPPLLIFGRRAVGMIGMIPVQWMRNSMERRAPSYGICSRERSGIYGKNPLRTKIENIEKNRKQISRLLWSRQKRTSRKVLVRFFV